MTECVTVTEDDIAVIERLLECDLSGAEKDNILACLGEGGDRQRVRNFQEGAYADCPHPDYCGDCGICAPFLPEPALICLLEIIGYSVRPIDAGSYDDTERPF